jgi:hypothetical protein
MTLFRKLLDALGLALKSETVSLEAYQAIEHANYKAVLRVATLEHPADGVPFCIHCHKPFRRNEKRHYLTGLHEQCPTDAGQAAGETKEEV